MAISFKEVALVDEGAWLLLCHKYRESQIDELLVLADCVQSAANVAGGLGCPSLLDPECQLHDCGFEGELVLIDLEQ